MRFIHCQPWPGDFSRRDAVYLPDGAQGVAIVAAGGALPAGATEISQGEYETRRAALLALLAQLAAIPPPADPDADTLGTLLGRDPAAVTAAEVRGAVLALARLLRRRGQI